MIKNNKWPWSCLTIFDNKSHKALLVLIWKFGLSRLHLSRRRILWDYSVNHLHREQQACKDSTATWIIEIIQMIINLTTVILPGKKKRAKNTFFVKTFIKKPRVWFSRTQFWWLYKEWCRLKWNPESEMSPTLPCLPLLGVPMTDETLIGCHLIPQKRLGNKRNHARWQTGRILFISLILYKNYMAKTPASPDVEFGPW